jgi:hypothetical protein
MKRQPAAAIGGDEEARQRSVIGSQAEGKAATGVT